MVGVGLFEPDECLVPVAHANVCQKSGVGSDGLAAVKLLQLFQRMASSCLLARAAISVGKPRPTTRPALQGVPFFQFGNSVSEPSFFNAGLGHNVRVRE